MTAFRSTGAALAGAAGAGPRQVQQPVDDLRGAERLPLDLLEQPRPRILGIGALEQHLREARDAGQRRVDLVRHAGGQQADRRHLLGDLQLLLELHARGDVLEDDDRADGRAPSSPSAARSGTTAALTISVRPSPGAAAVRAARATASRRRAYRAAPRGAPRRTARRTPRPARRPDRRRAARHAVQRFERAVPAHDPVVEVEHQQAVVERLEDVLVELAHPIELVGLEVQLPVEAGVLERGRHLAGDGGEQRHVLAVERLVGVLAAEREHRDRARPSKTQGTK